MFMRHITTSRKYKANVLGTADLAALRSPQARTHAKSPVEWKPINRSHQEGDTAVYCDGLVHLNAGVLRIRINLMRPYQQYFIYLVSNVPVNRVCVNQPHRGIEAPAHWHAYQSDGSEYTENIPEVFPVASIDSKIDLDIFRQAAECFANLCFIDLPDNWWVEPDLSKWNEVE